MPSEPQSWRMAGGCRSGFRGWWRTRHFGDDDVDHFVGGAVLGMAPAVGRGRIDAGGGPGRLGGAAGVRLDAESAGEQAKNSGKRDDAGSKKSGNEREERHEATNDESHDIHGPMTHQESPSCKPGWRLSRRR